MEIILATNNPHKVREIKRILKIKGLRILSLADFPQKFKIRENGRTFAENAKKKAKVISNKLKMAAIADDSGLCVAALRGAPGVRSARFVKPPVTADRLCKKLLKVMKNVPGTKRKAVFVCCVAIAHPGGKVRIVEGKCSGRIAEEMRGAGGFGYDPVFIPDGFKRTFAQMTGEQKNRLSHRGRAFAKVKSLLTR